MMRVRQRVYALLALFSVLWSSTSAGTYYVTAAWDQKTKKAIFTPQGGGPDEVSFPNGDGTYEGKYEYEYTWDGTGCSLEGASFSTNNTWGRVTAREYLDEVASKSFAASRDPTGCTQYNVLVHAPAALGTARFRASYLIRSWSIVTPPPKCDVSGQNIDLGTTTNSEYAQEKTDLTVTCTGDTDYTMRISGTTDGFIPYADGGRVRVGFGYTYPPAQLVHNGHAYKDVPVIVWFVATAYPGTATPGQYSASVVVTVALQ
ncbi:hypothetical protein AYJ10_11115 [Serratia marcescens]|nr:hypothetical protein AYJ10_11115 [Serratia marcescens]